MKKLPWIWLEGTGDEVAGDPRPGPEVVGTAKCGCTLFRSYNGSGDPAFEMCPMHEAAPEMLKTLKALECFLPMPCEVPTSGACHMYLDLPASMVRKIRRLAEKLA